MQSGKISWLIENIHNNFDPFRLAVSYGYRPKLVEG